MAGFSKIRTGILDHIQDGKMCPFDLGIYVFLHLRADWNTGIVQTCAATIAYQFNDASLTKQVQRSLRRLRDHGYVNYREGTGKRGRYPILLHKYRVAVGELIGRELNAWKNGDLVKPEYEPAGGDGTVVGRSCGGDAAVVRPILDLKDVLDYEDRIPAKNSPEQINRTTPIAHGQTPSEREVIAERLKHSPDPNCSICQGRGLVSILREYGERKVSPCSCRSARTETQPNRTTTTAAACSENRNKRMQSAHWSNHGEKSHESKGRNEKTGWPLPDALKRIQVWNNRAGADLRQKEWRMDQLTINVGGFPHQIRDNQLNRAFLAAIKKLERPRAY
jgi:hypothetical protein